MPLIQHIFWGLFIGALICVAVMVGLATILRMTNRAPEISQQPQQWRGR